MTAYVISSGVTTGYSLATGDTLKVSSGGVSDDSYVGSGAREYILAGGESEFDEIASGGSMVLSAGATVSSFTVDAGGTVTGAGILAGSSEDYGLVYAATLAGEAVRRGGTTSRVSVGSQAQLTVQAGGSSLDDAVLAGGGGIRLLGRRRARGEGILGRPRIPLRRGDRLGG